MKFDQEPNFIPELNYLSISHNSPPTCYTDLKAQNEALRQTNAKLQASYNRYLNLYEFAPVGYLTLDIEGIITQVNLAVASLLNIKREQLIGRSFDSIIDLQYQNFWHQQFALISKHVIKLSCALALKRNKNEYCYVRLELLRIMEPSNSTEIRVTITDITKHKHDEERLRLALEGSKLGFWEVDLKTGVTLVDMRYTKTFGYPPSAEIVGYPPAFQTHRDWWMNMIHPQDLEQVLEIGQQYQAGKINTYEIQYRAFKPDGQMIWALSKGVAVARCKDGKPLCMVGTAQDITERKNAEDRVSRQEKQFRALLESAPDPMVVSDVSGIITMINKQAESMFGYQRQEM
ncbi:hypothetical protein TI05_15535, partial [Achromatium sp. WMS3]